MALHNGSGKPRVAILIEQKVEDSEFQIPYNALKQAGAEVVVLGSRMNEEYKGKQGKLAIKPDGTTTEAKASQFDAVVIPGGMAPDRMRTNMKTVRFAQEAMQSGKWVAAVCHGPQVLIEADLLRGKRATGFRAIRKDMQNAGATFIDEPLVVDGNLLTSRRPGDLPIFTAAILHRLGLAQGLPRENDLEADWWKLGQQWGGSSQSEIADAINTAIAGERYGLQVFEHYADRIEHGEAKSLFQMICANKRRHLEQLEGRLRAIGGQKNLQANTSGALANLQNLFQGNGTVEILRHALGDMQTGVVDTFNLRNQITDPATVALFDAMEVQLAHDEQRVAEVYQGQVERAPAPEPTSRPAVMA